MIPDSTPTYRDFIFDETENGQFIESVSRSEQEHGAQSTEELPQESLVETEDDDPEITEEMIQELFEDEQEFEDEYHMEAQTAHDMASVWMVTDIVTDSDEATEVQVTNEEEPNEDEDLPVTEEMVKERFGESEEEEEEFISGSELEKEVKSDEIKTGKEVKRARSNKQYSWFIFSLSCLNCSSSFP